MSLNDRCDASYIPFRDVLSSLDQVEQLLSIGMSPEDCIMLLPAHRPSALKCCADPRCRRPHSCP